MKNFFLKSIIALALLGGALQASADRVVPAGTYSASSTPTFDRLLTSSSTATSTMAGNLQVSGNLRVLGAFYAPVSIVTAGNITPSADVTHSLGTAALRFLNLYSQNIFATSTTVTGNGTFGGTLGVTGQTTLGNASSSVLTATNFFSTLITATKGIFTNASSTNFTLAGAFYDSLGSIGSAGQTLLSTGTSTTWGAAASGSKFGGTGADGALSISSGTTTIDLGGAATYIKNYTSISITGTAELTFTNPAASGTIIMLKSQGDVTITSTANPGINAKGMGANGGLANQSGVVANYSFNTDSNGKIGVSGGATGAGGLQGHMIYRNSSLGMKAVMLAPGNGGGAGISGGANDYGPGGKGGGALLIEVGGALNFTGHINVSGNNGGNGVAAQNPGGGGGAAGTAYILYETLTANSGTITASGGTGGTAAGSGSNTSNRGGGGAGSPFAVGGAGGIGDAVGSAATGLGAGGGGGGTNSRAGGAGGGSMGGYVIQNTEF